MKEEKQIVSFYKGEGCDHVGRSLDDILCFGEVELEHVHDFIQWLFPINEISPFNPHAPIVDISTSREFRVDPYLQRNLCKSCGKMLHFYGLVCQKKGAIPIAVICASSFSRRAKNWLTPNNHNHKRLTRILVSLRLLGREHCSEKILGCLEEIVDMWRGKVTNETLIFWRGSQKISL